MNMEDYQYKNIVEQLAEINGRLKVVEDALRGDPMKGVDGVMGNQRKMLVDLYGTPETRVNAIVTRLSAVEDKDNRRMWFISGWAAGAGVVASLVFGAVKAFFFKEK